MLIFNGVPPLLTLFYPIRDAFGKHDDGGIGVGAYHIGHDGRIHDPYAAQPVYVTILIYHRQRIRGWPHLASAGEMMGCSYIGQ